MKTLLAAAAVLAGSIPVASGETFPSRTLTLIVPFSAGGPTDTIGRIVAQRMGAALGQTVVVENVTGAGGTIAVGRVARAAPDGYTIDIGQWDKYVGAIIYPINFDLQKDFDRVRDYLDRLLQPEETAEDSDGQPQPEQLSLID